MADRWLLVQEAAKEKDSPRYSGFSLRRCGYDDQQAAEAEWKEKERCARDGETYKPRVWRKPLVFGMQVKLGTAPGMLVERASVACIELTGRWRFVTKNGKRERVWKQFREPLYQELRDARLLGKSKVKIPSEKAKVAA